MAKEDRKILIGGQLKTYRPLVDGGFNISFTTQILNPEQLADINHLFQQHGVLFFSSKESMQQSDIDFIDNLDVELGETKTPSQRFRNVLYRLWEYRYKHIQPSFKTYYLGEMEKLIDSYKEKLETQ